MSNFSVVNPYRRELLKVSLSERVWFCRLTRAQFEKRFSNLGGDVFEHVMTVLAKIETFTTVARLFSFQDGIVKNDVEISNCQL